jgi:hypothetical protein
MDPDPDLDPDPDPDLDPDPAIFTIDLQDAKTAYYFLKVFLHHFSKIKSQKRSHKTVEIKVFLTFLLNDRRIPIHTYD